MSAPTQAYGDAVVVLGEAGLGELQFEFGEDFDGGEDRVGIFADPARSFRAGCDGSRASSSSSRRTSSLFCSMVSSGSTKTVWPLELAPWTTPCTRRFCSTLTGMTKRSPRMVTSSSCSGAAFGESAEISAERFLNQPLLFLDLAANAASSGEARSSSVPSGRILLRKERRKAVKSWMAAESSAHGGPLGAHGGRGMADDLAPLGGAIGDEDNIADLAGFKSGSGNAGFLDQLRDLGEAGELKASADAEELADFGGELMLAFNPGAIDRGTEFRDAALAQQRRGVPGEQVAQALELQQAGAGVEDRIGDKRHAL